MKKKSAFIFALLVAIVISTNAQIANDTWKGTHTVTNYSFVYDGSSHSPVYSYTVPVGCAQSGSIDGTESATDVNNYSLTVSITCSSNPDSHNGAFTLNWQITPRSISSAAISPSEDNLHYYYNTTIDNYTISDIVGVNNIISSNDYSYTRSGPTQKYDVGTHTLTFSGIRNYTGDKTTHYIVDPKPLTHEDIEIRVIPATYTGSEITPVVEIIDRGDYITHTLTNSDYNIVLSQTMTNAGTYENVITITGTGNYTGTVKRSFTIQPRSINDVTVVASRNYNADLTNDASNVLNYVTLSYKGIPLVSGNDYTVTAIEQSYHNAGTYENAITITGKDGGNFTGTRVVDFFIGDGTDLTGALIVAEDTYTGQSLPPSSSNITVTLGGTPLTYGTDYNVVILGTESEFIVSKTYENAIRIVGINQYVGTITNNYVIQPRDINTCTNPNGSIIVNDLTWTSSTLNPNINISYGGVIIDNTNYTYSVNPTTVKDPDVYTLTIIGKNNLKGTYETTFKVIKNVSESTITLPAMSTMILPDGAATPIGAVLTITDTSTGKELIQGTDYTVDLYSDEGRTAPTTITADNIYYARINGTGVFNGTRDVKLYVFDEYYVYAETAAGVSLHLTEATSSGANAMLSSHSGSVCNPANLHLTVPASTTITLGGETIYFNIKGIERNTFTGNSNLHWVDVTALTAFTPSSLDRTINGTPFNGLSRQAFVYLNGNTITGENYIYKVGPTDYRCDVFKIYDDNNGIQQGFDDATAAKWGMMIPIGFRANTVTNTRQLLATNASGKQQGYTTCLPYALPIPSSFKAYTLSYSKNAQVGFTEVTGTLAALTPYVLIPSASGSPLSTTNAEISQTSTGIAYTALTPVSSAASSGQSLYQMTGTMEYLSGVAGKYIMQSGNVWNECQATDWPNSCVLPMRAYISISGSAPAPPVVYSTFTGADGSTTTVSNLQLDADDNLDGQTVYDLQGRRVSQPTKGLYIVNGKKRIIK